MRKLSANAKPITILKAVAAKIQAHPDQYNQERYVEDTECGTRYCVAGWVCALTGGEGRPLSARYTADTRLGLSSDQSWSLFHGGALVGVLPGNYPDPGTPRHARAGVAHIEKFMRTHLGYTGPKLWQVKAKGAKKVAAKRAVK